MDNRRMCPHCRAFITAKDRVCPYCNEQVGARAIDRRDPSPILGGIIPHAHFTTVLILSINIGLYLCCTLFSMRAGNGEAVWDIDPRTLFHLGASFRAANLTGEWWRLVTAGFLHGGLLHIGMNSWVLFDLGAQVEEVYGTSRMLVVYFVSSVCGFFFSMVWQPNVSVGASAALMGLIGAMIALGVRHRSALGSAIRAMYTRWAVYILLFGLLPGLHVDNAAHIGGLAAGFAVAYLAGEPRLAEHSWRESFWRGASYICILLTVICFLKMYLFFTSAAQ